jgi:hypothetical protein
MRIWQAIWDLAKAPFTAVFTGRYMGYPVESRNPLHWISMWGWALLAIAFVLLAYPVLLLVQLVSMRLYMRQAGTTRILDTGVEVSAKRGAASVHYDWASICEVRTKFVPPFTNPELVLTSGEHVELPIADVEVLATALSARGIHFDRNPVQIK